MKLGTSYSHREIKHLSLNNSEAFDALLSLKFDIIRLGCYWDEIQPTKEAFDFSKIRELVDKCEKVNQNVLLTVGMKAPRWPEFYFPCWLKDKDNSTIFPEVELFIKETVKTFKDYKCVKYWQVENEPLDPSGPEKRSIKQEFLRKEIELVRDLDKTRNIIVNIWGNEMKQRSTFAAAIETADIVGLDLYYKVPVISKIYFGPRGPDKYFKNVIEKSPVPVWITELQAEPWERNEKTARSANPPSMSPEILLKNYKRAVSLNPEVILFWGFEYWYWRKIQGDGRYWKTIEKINKEIKL